MSDDPNVLPPTVVPPGPPVIVEVPEPERPGRVTCEFCGCSLDSKGNIIRRGEGARKYLSQEDEIARLRKELDGAQSRNTELAAQVSALTPKERRSILY